MARTRTAIGREFSASERHYGWLTDEAVELDTLDGYDVTRRRVLLDEVCLVTLHRARRRGLLVLWAVLWAMFASVILVARKADVQQAFALLSSPFALAFLIHLALGTDYVTVWGVRSKVRVAFNYRKGRAREVFALVVSAVQAAQARRREELQLAPQAPPAVGDQPAPAVTGDQPAPAVPRGDQEVG